MYSYLVIIINKSRLIWMIDLGSEIKDRAIKTKEMHIWWSLVIEFRVVIIKDTWNKTEECTWRNAWNIHVNSLYYDYAVCRNTPSPASWWSMELVRTSKLKPTFLSTLDYLFYCHTDTASDVCNLSERS